LVQDVDRRPGPRNARRVGRGWRLYGRHGHRRLGARSPDRLQPPARTVVRRAGAAHWPLGLALDGAHTAAESGGRKADWPRTFALATLGRRFFPAVAAPLA